MKKASFLGLLLAVSLALSGCAPGTASQQAQSPFVQVHPTAAPGTVAGEGTPAIPPVSPKDVPDIDLQGLGYPMAYAQVYDIARDPCQHVGKTMRIEGMYYGAEYQELGEVVHSILVADSAGCCEVGLEFMVTGSPVWPEEYPPNFSRISLTGVLGTITAGEGIYALLTVNSIDLLEGTPS